MQPTTAYADPALIDLGTAADFAVLAGTSVTAVNRTWIGGYQEGIGNLGVSPGSEVTGFPPGWLEPPGAMHRADAVADEAQADLTTAYNDAAGRPCDQNLNGQDLGDRTLTAGVYCFDGAAQLTGWKPLILDGQGNPDALFIFQIGATFSTTLESWVILESGTQTCNVFWQVGGSAILGFGSLEGSVMAQDSISGYNGSAFMGRLMALNGSVTLDENAVAVPSCAPDVGVPQAPLLGSAGSAIAVVGFLIGTAVLVLRRRTELAHI